MKTLHCEIDGRGRDLVMLHGWGLHSGVWDGLLPALTERFRVHRVDLPGHGHSAGSTIEAFDDAARAVGACIPRGSIVMGWSLGGLFAQRIASWEATPIRAMVLVGSTPCFMQRSAWTHAMRPATLESFARDLRRAPQETLEQFVRLNALNGSGSREAIRALHATLRQRPLPAPDALDHGLAWLRGVDLRDDAARLATPCIVVHGTRDAIAPIEAGRWLAREMPRARLVELEDAAHLPFVSHAARVVEAVEALDA